MPAGTQHGAHTPDVILADPSVAVEDHIVRSRPRTLEQNPVATPPTASRRRLELAAPTLVAALFAIVYVVVSPTSLDLAAHLFRAELFRKEGFGVWNNFWYAGHDIPGYSVLFPAVSAALTPQLAGAIAAVGTSTLFTPLARRHCGSRALAGSMLFGAFTAVDLFTGRLAFAFGALPAFAAVLALDLGWWPLGCVLAVLSALCSPVAALFAALVAGGYAIGAFVRVRRARAVLGGAAVFAAAIVPVALLAVAFPEGGAEPFDLLTMAPVLVVALAAFACVDRRMVTLRACIAVYAAAVLITFVIPSPVGSNVARMGTLLAAPLATVLFFGRRPRLLAAAILPLLYIGWQAPIRDLSTSSHDQSVSTTYYQPLLRFLASRGGPPFRIEIPFTRFHWEAYIVATHVSIARGWERQLDIHDNPIFYRRGALTSATYRQWLDADAIRFVAVPDAQLDYSSVAEVALIDHGLPYLRLAHRTAHWRIYAVRNPTPLAQGPVTLTHLGPDWLSMRARRPGSVLVHIHYSPYWEITQGAGCVEPAGDLTRVVLRRAGAVRLETHFAPDRVGASSPRCTASAH